MDKVRLQGSSEEAINKYLRFYENMNFEAFAMSVFYQYWKYANVFVYVFEDGRIRTLPPHHVRVAGVAVDGEPIIEYNALSIVKENHWVLARSSKRYIDDDSLNVLLQGYPPEVADEIRKRKGIGWVQLNPKNTFAMQDVKEDWMRYAVPMIASALLALKKKSLIADWENALLNLSMRSFCHVKYGDKEGHIGPNEETLSKVRNGFRKAMTGTALVVTDAFCEANFYQPDLEDLFRYDKYASVNSQILAAGGVSEIMVSGNTSDSSTFATAQVSMQTAAIRIKSARQKFCAMMNRINRRLNELHLKGLPHMSDDRIPEFTYPPVDLNGSQKLQEACKALYEKGLVSKQTMLDSYGLDIEQEIARRKREASNGTDATLIKPDIVQDMIVEEVPEGKSTYVRDGKTYYRSSRKEETEEKEETTLGRPTLSVEERSSDPYKSETGRLPKPSNPEGSSPAT